MAAVLCPGWVSAAKSSLLAQAALAREFWIDRRFRAPMVVVWVAVWGSALHDPVTTFYYLKLGASAIDIGRIGFIGSVGGMVMAPVYGYLLDRRGPFLAIVSTATLCAVGCAVRGCAQDLTLLYLGGLILGFGGNNLIMVVLAFLTSSTSPERRSLVVSGYIFQITALRILGKALYTPWNAVVQYGLGVSDTLLRFRIHMVICPLFCVFGAIFLGLNSRAVRTAFARAASSSSSAAAAAASKASNPASRTAEAEAAVSVIIGDDHDDDDEGDGANAGASGGDDEQAPLCPQDGDPGAGRGSGGGHGPPRAAPMQRVPFALVAACLVLQSCSMTVATVLWPLYLHDAFGWGANEYAYVLFLSSVLSTAVVAALPVVEQRSGRFRTAITALAIASVTSALAFSLPSTAAQAWAVGCHILLTLALLTSLSLLEPSLKALASLYVSEASQGRSFGALATLSSVGYSVGSIAGTMLYKVAQPGDAGEGGGAAAAAAAAAAAGAPVPFFLVSVLLVVAGTLLWIVSNKYGIPNTKRRGGEKGSASRYDRPFKRDNRTDGGGSGDNGDDDEDDHDARLAGGDPELPCLSTTKNTQ